VIGTIPTEREIDERRQNATTSEDEALFESASRIIKLEVKEKTRRLLDALQPSYIGRKKDLASRLIEHQRKQSTQGQRNFQ
jgi:hypothetical protein